MTTTFQETETEKVLTRDEALKFIRNYQDGNKVRFQVSINCFLPTEENRGFEGIASAIVSRRQFGEIVDRACSEILAGRGAKVKLRINRNDRFTFIYLA